MLVGAVSAASGEVEKPEKVAQTIKEATQYVEPERMYPCTNCGLAPVPRQVAIGKLEALAAGRSLARDGFSRPWKYAM